MWRKWKEEVKEVIKVSAPLVTLATLQCLTQVVVITIAKHLGQLPLSAVAIANSLTDVSGFSFIIGLCGGLETLCGQAYGAKQYEKIGIYTYSAMIWLFPLCIPISITWIFMDKLVGLGGQNPLVAREARNYALLRIPGLASASLYYPLARYLQCQGLSLPLLFCAILYFGLNALTCWFLAFKMLLGIQALALSLSLCNFLNMICVAIYIMCSPSCQRTRVAFFTSKAFSQARPFLLLGFPAAVMVCLKWWTLELVVFLADRLPDPQLETSVLSICLNMLTLHFAIPTGIGVAASIRVAKHLGAGNPEGARLTAWVATLIGSTEAVVMSGVLLGCRYKVGHAYSQDEQVVNYVSSMIPLVCLSLITDGLQMVLSGVAKGSGRQHLGAFANVGAFYVVGIPTAVLLGLHLDLRAKGFWIGILIASFLQSIFFILIASFTDWHAQAVKAKERVTTPCTEQITDENN